MSYYEYHVAKRYIQFDGALKEFPRYASLIGKKILILLASGPVTERVKRDLSEGFNKSSSELIRADLSVKSPRYASYKAMAQQMDEWREKMQVEFLDLGDPIVSEKNVEETARYVQKQGFDTVVGVGGGKGLDYARAITHYVPVNVILIPTLAATNASISTLSVIYSQDGKQIQAYWRMNNAPDLVLVDTALLIDNGPRILAAGMGDIISTYYEGICNMRLSDLEKEFSDLSYRGIQDGVKIIEERGADVIAATKNHEITPAFESVLSMIMHNPGPMWTICTLGFGHVIDEIFLNFEASHQTLHGLRVGYATKVMLLYQGASEEEIEAYVAFCKSVGIPTTLKELKLDGISYEDWMEACKNTIEKTGTYKTLPFKTTPEEIVRFLLKVEKEESEAK